MSVATLSIRQFRSCSIHRPYALNPINEQLLVTTNQAVIAAGFSEDPYIFQLKLDEERDERKRDERDRVTSSIDETVISIVND